MTNNTIDLANNIIKQNIKTITTKELANTENQLVLPIKQIIEIKEYLQKQGFILHSILFPKHMSNEQGFKISKNR